MKRRPSSLSLSIHFPLPLHPSSLFPHFLSSPPFPFSSHLGHSGVSAQLFDAGFELVDGISMTKNRKKERERERAEREREKKREKKSKRERERKRGMKKKR